MSWFQMILRSGAETQSFQDDAQDCKALGERLEVAKKEGLRLITTYTAKIEGSDKTVQDITGSWDPNDIMHVVAFMEAVDLEGDAADDDEPDEDERAALMGKKRAKG